MPLSPALADWLSGGGHDAVHAGARGLHDAPDEQIMNVAVVENRTVVTADLDYPRLLALGGAAEPSLILFRDGAWSEMEVVRRMTDVLATLSETEIEASIIVVDHASIRRRRLPIG